MLPLTIPAHKPAEQGMAMSFEKAIKPDREALDSLANPLQYGNKLHLLRDREYRSLSGAQVPNGRANVKGNWHPF